MLYKLTSTQLRVPSGFDSTDPSYVAFLARLETRGYFEGEVQGSARWVAKEQHARAGWLAAKSDRCVLRGSHNTLSLT